MDSILSDNFFLALNELNEENYQQLPTPKRNSSFHTKFPSKSVAMEKLAQCSTFSGYSHDNAKKFLSEFNSYALLHELHDYDGRKVAAFHLHLKGPALTWFNTLSDRSKRIWSSIEAQFQEKFINFANHSSVAMMEGQVFNSLKLGYGQSIEDFHSQLIEKGSLLKKPDHEILARFIDGLPEKMAFFVRAGQPSDLSSAFTSAKMAETCGYRVQDPLPQPTQKSPESDSAIATLTQEVAKLSNTVSELLISKQHQPAQANGNQFQRGQFNTQNNQNQLMCYGCNFPGHRKSECNWNGKSQPTPGKCQLCRQQGHPAFRCKTQYRQQGNFQNRGDNRPTRQGNP